MSNGAKEVKPTKSENKSLEEKVAEPMPNLEEMATKFANMEENHKMNQILPSVMDAFVNFPGVKYKDTKGVEHYKTKFTTDEANKITDSVFDKLAYHVHLRRYGDMTPDFFEALKKMKDPDGVPLVEAEVQRALGISKQELKRKILENKDDLTPKHFIGIVEDIMEHHQNYVRRNILGELGEEHKEYLADFVKKKVAKHDLKGKVYKIKDKYTLRDVMPAYLSIASQFYKKDSDAKPEEKK